MLHLWPPPGDILQQGGVDGGQLSYNLGPALSKRAGTRVHAGPFNSTAFTHCLKHRQESSPACDPQLRHAGENRPERKVRLSLRDRFLCHKTTTFIVVVGTTCLRALLRRGWLRAGSPAASARALSVAPAEADTTRRMRRQALDRKSVV